MDLLLLGLLGLIVIVAAYVMVSYNRFVMQRNRVEEAFSTMDVYLLKRYDLIPNLVETVKGYAKHEKETFERVIQARNQAVSANTLESKVEAENAFGAVMGRLFALAEAYPDLKANTNFIDLQTQLKAIEEDIANARKFFNAVTRQFNTMVEVFPANIVANLFKFTKKPLFEVEDVSQRQNVKVQF
jgi:LemA protein